MIVREQELFEVSTLDALNMPKKDDGSVDYQQDFSKEAFLTVSGQLNAGVLYTSYV